MHVGSKNYRTDVVNFIVSSQEEEQGFNVNSSMKTSVYYIVGVRELDWILQYLLSFFGIQYCVYRMELHCVYNRAYFWRISMYNFCGG